MGLILRKEMTMRRSPRGLSTHMVEVPDILNKRIKVGSRKLEVMRSKTMNSMYQMVISAMAQS